MMKFLSVFVLPFIFLGQSSFLLRGQPLVVHSVKPEEICVQEVRDIYKKMNTAKTKDAVVYMNYTLVTKMREKDDNGKDEITSHIEMMMSEEQSRYLSEQVNVYMDTKDNFTVIPIRKMIFWSNSLMDVDKEKRLKNYNLLNDSLFTVCKLIDCKTLAKETGGYNKIITLSPVERARNIFKYEKIIFYINSTKKEIKKISIECLPSLSYKAVELTYNKIDYDYKIDLSKPVRDLFISKNEQLNKNYIGYKLADNRVSDKKN
jgi:hypothetical protein